MVETSAEATPVAPAVLWRRNSAKLIAAASLAPPRPMLGDLKQQAQSAKKKGRSKPDTTAAKAWKSAGSIVRLSNVLHDEFDGKSQPRKRRESLAQVFSSPKWRSQGRGTVKGGLKALHKTFTASHCLSSPMEALARAAFDEASLVEDAESEFKFIHNSRPICPSPPA